MDNTYETLKGRVIEIIDNLQGNTIDFEDLYTRTVGGFEDSHKRDMLIAILYEFKDIISIQHDPYKGLVVELLNSEVKETITRVKIVNKSGLLLPEYAKLGDSGFDFKFNPNLLPETLKTRKLVLQPAEIKQVPTGLFIELPLGKELQIRPKSGLSLEGVICFLGTVDSGYRGEIKITLINLSQKPYTFKEYHKLAQGVITDVNKAEFVQVSELNNDTARGDGGFGSSGK